MSLRLGALYDALRTAQGVSEDDAKKAAEEVAGYDKALAALDLKLAVLSALVATNITLTLGVLWFVFRLAEQLAAIAAKVAVIAAKVGA